MRTVLKVIAFTFIFVLVSCDKKNSDTIPIDDSYSYFPIDSTKQFIYAVDSIAYNKNLNRIDTFTFKLKTVFEESFLDRNDVKTWRLTRFAKYKESLPFVELQNHFVQFVDNKFLYTDNNHVLLKTIFPVKIGNVWNGNLYNSLDKINSTVDYKNETFQLADTSFGNTIKITEWDNLDFIFDNNRFSVYQNKVGLVYFRNKNIETQTNQGKEEVSGYDITQKLIAVQPR